MIIKIIKKQHLIMKQYKHLSMAEVLKRRKQKHLKQYHKYSSLTGQSTLLNNYISLNSHNNSQQQLCDLVNNIVMNGKLNQKLVYSLSDFEKQNLLCIISKLMKINFNMYEIMEHLIIKQYNDVTIVHESFAKTNNYFVLKGQIRIFRKTKYWEGNQSEQNNCTNYCSSLPNESYHISYSTSQQFQKDNLNYEQIQKLETGKGLGHIFKNQLKSSGLKIIFIQAILLVIQNASIFQNNSTTYQGISFKDKANLIKSFPIFNPLNRTIENFTPYFHYKQYPRNQIIYAYGSKDLNFYLIAEGEVVIQFKAPSNGENNTKNNRYKSKIIRTVSLGIGNHFGEQQFFTKNYRKCSVRCISACCKLLIISQEKFFKLLAYSDFYDALFNSAQIKSLQSLSVIKSHCKVKSDFVNQNRKKIKTQSKQQFDLKHQFLSHSFKKTNNSKIKNNMRVIHGNSIQKVYGIKTDESNHRFSMLGTDKKLYDESIRKFRKYSYRYEKNKSKQDVKQSNNSESDIKRIWKVLKLDNVLSQQKQVVADKSGRISYQQSLRRQQNYKQLRICRPKSSNTYFRNKIQYIAYLQQFQN